MRCGIIYPGEGLSRMKPEVEKQGVPLDGKRYISRDFLYLRSDLEKELIVRFCGLPLVLISSMVI